jgi:hypothetical protein
MTNDRDYLEQLISAHKHLLGREPTPAEIAGVVARFNKNDRALVGVEMEADDGPLTVNQAAKRLRFEQAVRNTRKALTEIDR